MDKYGQVSSIIDMEIMNLKCKNIQNIFLCTLTFHCSADCNKIYTEGKSRLKTSDCWSYAPLVVKYFDTTLVSSFHNRF
jgi:hypothetical protein